MGNRATVYFRESPSTFSARSEPDYGSGVYLHWHGGPESVYAFVDDLDRRGVRADRFYAPARFAQIVGEYLSATGEHSLSLGVYPPPRDVANLEVESPGDNGLYVLEGSAVVGRYVEYGYGAGDWLSPGEIADEMTAARATGVYAGITGEFVKLAAFRGEEDAVFHSGDGSMIDAAGGEWPT